MHLTFHILPFPTSFSPSPTWLLFARSPSAPSASLLEALPLAFAFAATNCRHVPLLALLTRHTCHRLRLRPKSTLHSCAVLPVRLVGYPCLSTSRYSDPASGVSIAAWLTTPFICPPTHKHTSTHTLSHIHTLTLPLSTVGFELGPDV